MKARGSLFLWFLILLFAAGAAASTGDLLIVAGRFWWISGPLLLAYAVFVFVWGAGPAGTREEATAAMAKAREAMGFWGQLALRLVITVITIAATLALLAALLYLLVLAVENLEYTIPFVAVAAVLAGMGLWGRRKRKPPRPIVRGADGPSAEAAPMASNPAVAAIVNPPIVQGGSGSSDIVT
jgi:hypothetical protein